MDIYSSSKLPNDSRSIRLLTLEPSRNYNSIVTCRLSVSSTDCHTKYEALSYTWGNPEDKAPILVDNEEISVTKNLATALYALRHSTRPRTLWVDAMCINQEDNIEKSFQVPMMALIYRNCTRTVVWLGDSDANSRKAFDLVRKGVKDYPRVLSSVLRRPWFRRVWIIQEVASAPTAVVQCGKDMVEWEQLATVADLIPQLGSMVNPMVEGDNSHLNPAFYPRILEYARKRIRAGTRFELLEAMRCFQPFDATLAVDKVYGILGLVNEPGMVKVDYTSSASELYQSAALDIIRHTRRLDILLDCLQSTNEPNVADLPSWVPDWSITDGPLDNPITTLTGQEIFHASRDTQIQYEDLTPDGQGALSLEGQIIGTIAGLGDPFPSSTQLRRKYWPYGSFFPNPRFFEAITEIMSVFNTWKAVICQRSNSPSLSLSSNYATGERLFEVFYHTLNSTGGPFSSPDLDRHFTTYMQSSEFVVRLFALYARLISKTPWPLIWLFSGPFFVSCSFVLVLKIMRQGFVLDPPLVHSDISRQTSVMGRTDNDLAGLFPAPSLSTAETMPSRVGDVIVIFKGASRPYVIRQERECWRIIGVAYVHGIMYGAAFDSRKCVTIKVK